MGGYRRKTRRVNAEFERLLAIGASADKSCIVRYDLADAHGAAAAFLGLAAVCWQLRRILSAHLRAARRDWTLPTLDYDAMNVVRVKEEIEISGANGYGVGGGEKIPLTARAQSCDLQSIEHAWGMWKVGGIKARHLDR